MKVLIVGASGATGRLVVEQCLNRGLEVKAIVRSAASLEKFRGHDKLTVIQASLLDLSDNELIAHTKTMDAIVSCLGHNLTWKGMYCQPRRLVTDAAKRLCSAIEANSPVKPVKYLLMNTSANRNRDINEPISFAERCVVALLRLLLPPHVDNEKAADFLRINIGQNHKMVEWIAVRPDGLIDEDSVTAYEQHASPTRSAIFNAGKISRINVAHFMAELLTDNTLWNKWRGQMPLIYNS